jgi:hypothetical protein
LSMVEEKFADEFVETFVQEALSNATECSLEYLATTVNCTVTKSLFRGTLPQSVPLNSENVKHMLSLKPAKVRKPAIQLKEEMMKRYVDDGYYFLEAYIDGMLERGTHSFF